MLENAASSPRSTVTTPWHWRTARWTLRSPKVWLVDDCEEDQCLAMRAIGDFCVLEIFDSGESMLQALQSIRELSGIPARDGPDLVLLDYRIAGLTGPEVLRRMSAMKSVAITPTIIFASSPSPEDVMRCYEAGCNSCVLKPQNWVEYREVLHSIVRYWLDVSAIARS